MVALSSGISYCETGGRLVFLDRHRDRYFCLSGEAETGFRNLARGPSTQHHDDAVIERLLTYGLLDPAAEDDLPVACPGPPTPVTSLVDEDERCRFTRAGRALFGLAAISLELKLRPLHRCIARIERCKARLPPGGTNSGASAREIAAAFRWTGLLIPSLDQCLPRSIALAHALVDAAIRPTVILAVRLRPFGAHCWVQVDDLLLNESLDQARTFTPILVA